MVKIVSDGTLYVRQPVKGQDQREWPPAEPVDPGTPVEVEKAEAESLIERGLARRWADRNDPAPVDAGAAADAAATADAASAGAPDAGMKVGKST